MRRDLVIRRIGIAEPGVRLVRSWWSSAAGETSRSADCVACAAAAPAPVRVVWSCCAIAGAGRDASARSQQQVAPPPEKPVGPPSCEAAGSRASIRQGRFIAPGAAAPREKTKAARGATSLIAGLPAIQSTSNEGYAGGRKRLRVGWRNGWRDLAYLESNVRPERRGDTLAQWEGAASDEALMDAYARGDAAGRKSLDRTSCLRAAPAPRRTPRSPLSVTGQSGVPWRRFQRPSEK